MMARRMESAGDLPGALASLERARQLDPGAAEIPAEIAGYYYRQNWLSEAVTAAQQALKIDKDNIEAHHILGTVFRRGPTASRRPRRVSRRSRARSRDRASVREQVHAADGDVPEPGDDARAFDARAGKADLAVPILEKVAAQAPWSAQPLLLLDEAQISQGKLDEAEPLLAKAAEIDPRYFAQLGQFYERQGKWEDSAAAYEEAIGSSRQPNRDLQIRYAAVLINMEDGAAKASQILAELLKASPNDTRLLYHDETAERTAGDEKAAEATARKIVSIDATSVSGMRALVATLSDRFDYQQIVEVVTPLVKDPSRATGREIEGAAVLVQLGIAQQQLANWDGSIAAFTAAKSLTPDDTDIDAYLVQANLTARRFNRAETLAREALERDRDQPRMVRLRAQALLKSGKVAEANKLLEDAVAREPKSREFVVGLADLYADQKRTDDALRLLGQARMVFGDDQTLAMRFANVYEGGGRLDDAEKELRKLMAEDPLDADAMNSLSYMLAEHNLRLDEAVDLARRALQAEDQQSRLSRYAWMGALQAGQDRGRG